MTDCDKCKEYDKEKNYCPVFCNVINDTLTDRAIEELEKLKGKMEVIHDRHKINFRGYSMSVAKECIEIIDERISELKGENNA